VAIVRKRTVPTERPPLVGEVSTKLCGCCVVSATNGHCLGHFCIYYFFHNNKKNPTAVNLGFLDRSRYFFIQAAPQLSSRGWVDPLPDPLLLRKFGTAGNRTRERWICSQKHWPLDTEAVPYYIYTWIKYVLDENVGINVLFSLRIHCAAGTSVLTRRQDSGMHV
jgi:hypothetical protein